MYDPLWEESPMIQEMREKYRMEGLQEDLQQGMQQGIQQGEVIGLQRFLVNVVQTKYPDLTEFVQQQASHLNKPGMLELLIQQVLTAPNADTARWLLKSTTEM